jgi:hypothetical protein
MFPGMKIHLTRGKLSELIEAWRAWLLFERKLEHIALQYVLAGEMVNATVPGQVRFE